MCDLKTVTAIELIPTNLKLQNLFKLLSLINSKAHLKYIEKYGWYKNAEDKTSVNIWSFLRSYLFIFSKN